MSLSRNDEAPWGNEVLPKKNRIRVAYKGHLNKLEKYITIFFNEFVPGNMLHIKIM